MTQTQQPTTPLARHDASIDTLRAFACILIVVYHVIGSTGEFGMRVPEYSDWRLLGDLGAFISISLFAFISGYVFNSKSASWMDFGILLRKKLLRLGIPLVVVTYIFYLLACATNSSFCVASPWWIALFPYAHFWFLQAILLIMVVVLIANTIAGPNSRLLTVIAFPISLLALFFLPVFPVDLFSINSVKYLFPFFLLGQILRDRSPQLDLESNRKYRRVAYYFLGAILVVFWGILFQTMTAGQAPNFYRISLFGVAFAMLNCLFLFLLKPQMYLLSIIGPFTFTIYLFHPIFSSACRRLLLQMGLDGQGLALFSGCLIAGVLLPILVQKIASQNPVTALLLLGVVKPSSSQSKQENSARPNANALK